MDAATWGEELAWPKSLRERADASGVSQDPAAPHGFPLVYQSVRFHILFEFETCLEAKDEILKMGVRSMAYPGPGRLSALMSLEGM